MNNKINSILFDTEIVLWWDLPENFVDGDYFIISCSGKDELTTYTTHVELKDIKPNTKINVRIYFVCKNEKTLLFNNDFVTAEKKAFIDITKEPYCVDNKGTKNVKAIIQSALDNLKDDQILYFPSGKYLTGSLKIHSNSEIYLDEGAVIMGSEKACDYLPKIKSRFEGVEDMCYSSLINIGDLDHEKDCTTENVIIRGKGKIIGGGDALRKDIINIEYALSKDYIDSLDKDITGFKNEIVIPARKRGRLVNISNSKNVVLYGITFENSPSWNIHMIYSKNIVTACCSIKSVGIHNGDGWDPDSSADCTIFGSNICTSDDCIAIKSGKNPEGNIINRPSRNIDVFDIKTEYGHGISLGSEMSGGLENIRIWQCDAVKTWFGLHFKTTKKRGGFIKNINMRFVKAPCVMIHGITYNDDGNSSESMPYIENMTFNSCEFTGNALNSNNGKSEDVAPILIEGVNKEFTLDNIQFINLKNITKNEVGDIGNIKGVKFSETTAK